MFGYGTNVMHWTCRKYYMNSTICNVFKCSSMEPSWVFWLVAPKSEKGPSECVKEHKPLG